MIITDTGTVFLMETSKPLVLGCFLPSFATLPHMTAVKPPYNKGDNNNNSYY